MEKSKNYRVLVEQVDRFSYEFSVSATSETEARGVVEQMIEEEPLDTRKDAYDGTDVALEVVTDPIQVHTVEALFDIDKDVSDEEVILLDDLSEKQKTFLGLGAKEAPWEESTSFYVFSSGGSLKVSAKDGSVIECTTIHNEDNELKQILKFDIEEFKTHYKVAEIPGNLDILDLGYWTKNGQYEKPVEDWRNEMRRVE